MATTGGVTILSDSFSRPYGVADLGASANLPTLPNLYQPVQGVRMPHGVKTSFYLPVYLSATTSLGTGLTISLLLNMDPVSNNCDLGATNAYFDVIVGPLTTGTSVLDDSVFASSTADTGTASSLPTSSNKVVILTITSAVAHENSMAVNTWGLVRVRRLGDNALDTNLGIVTLVAVAVVGT